MIGKVMIQILVFQSAAIYLNSTLNKQCPGPPQPSQIILLSASPGVLVQSPLDIAIFVLQCATSNLKTSHRHPRPNLCELDTLVSRLYKDMVPDLYAVIDVLECHHPTSDFGSVCDGFSRREDVFQDSHDAESQSGCESFEYQVRVRFADGAAGAVWNIMAEDDVVERK